jgi:hypothetical protein
MKGKKTFVTLSKENNTRSGIILVEKPYLYPYKNKYSRNPLYTVKKG